MDRRRLTKYGIFQLTTSHGGRHNLGLLRITAHDLSTHDLTRRSTRPLQRLMRRRRPFNSRPHTEVDVRSALIPFSAMQTFNSRPHTEVDPDRSFKITVGGPFNSRPHTEVDAAFYRSPRKGSSFQLTTSHGGRHYVPCS